MEVHDDISENYHRNFSFSVYVFRSEKSLYLPQDGSSGGNICGRGSSGRTGYGSCGLYSVFSSRGWLFHGFFTDTGTAGLWRQPGNYSVRFFTGDGTGDGASDDRIFSGGVVGCGAVYFLQGRPQKRNSADAISGGCVFDIALCEFRQIAEGKTEMKQGNEKEWNNHKSQGNRRSDHSETGKG